ncbi:hypothetical protein D3C81_1217020 [compost metagenome]
MPFGQISVDESIQWAILGEQLGTHRFDLIASRLQRLFNQFVFGLEVRVKASVGQPQRFHQRLQASRPNTVPTESHGSFLDDALVGLGFMVLRVTHLKSPQQCAILTNENGMVTVLLLLESMQMRLMVL